MTSNARHAGFVPLGTIGGFTLIELLIVIGVLAVLSVAVVIALNPAELLKQSRDAVRLSDLAILNRAIGIVGTEDVVNLGSASTIYVSLPDTSPICANVGLPAPPSGWTYNCVTNANLRLISGSGWLPINFPSFTGGAPFSALPVDPVNTAASGLYYAYVTGGSYALTGALESNKHLAASALPDGGTDAGRVELGTDINLWTQASGLSVYWKFDEGSGTTAGDSSGGNVQGSFVGSPQWVNGKVGKALDFNGTADYVWAPNSSRIHPAIFTVMAWVKFEGGSLNRTVMGTRKTNFLGDPQGYSLDALTLNWSFAVGDTSQAVSQISGGGAPTSTWTHIVGVYDGFTMTLYKNGIALASASSSYVFANSDFRVAARITTPVQYLSAVIDEVRIYNRPLSATEIQGYYNATR